MLEEELAERAAVLDNQYAGLLSEIVIHLGPYYPPERNSTLIEFTLSYKHRALPGTKGAQYWIPAGCGPRFFGPYFLIGPSLPALEAQLEERVVGLCSYLEV
jgi:hypothetical protein